MSSLTHHWEPETGLSPLQRQAHYNCAIGPYVVSMCGYLWHDKKNYEFRRPYIHYYHIYTKEEFIITCEADNTSIETQRYTLNPFSLSSPAGCCVNENKVYLFGGFSLHIQFAVNELIEIDFSNIMSPIYRVIHGSGRNYPNDAPAPLPRDKASLVYWQNYLFAFGGYGVGPSDVDEEDLSNYLIDEMNFQYSDDVYGWNNQLLIYNLNKRQWTIGKTMGNIPGPRAAHSACNVNHTMYIFGGRVPCDSQGSIIRVNDLYSLDMRRLQWTKIQLHGDLPCGRSWMSVTKIVDCNSIVIYGGQNTAAEALDCMFVVSLDQQTSSKVKLMKKYSQRLWHSACWGYNGQLYITGGISVGPYIQDSEKDWASPALLTLSVGSPASLQKLCFNQLIKYKILNFYNSPNNEQKVNDSLDKLLPKFYAKEWKRLLNCNFTRDHRNAQPLHLAGH